MPDNEVTAKSDGGPGIDECGIRTYFLPDDPPGRYQRDVEIWKIRNGKSEFEDPAWCGVCGFIGEFDEYETFGAEDGEVFCPNCQEEIDSTTCCLADEDFDLMLAQREGDGSDE